MMSGSVQIWRGFGDSEIGPLHQRLGLPNQDAFCLQLLNSPILITVSDGLGSKSLSQLGSQAVCRAVTRISQNCKEIAEPLLLLERFHSYWLEELKGVDIEQCGCTALFAIVLEEHTFIAQLGDGDCCIIRSREIEGKQHISFLVDKSSENFANQTYSLGNQFQSSQWKYLLLPTVELEACFLVTDGIADDLVLEHRSHFYIELLNQYRQLSDDEVQADVRSWISQWPVIGHSDDKTIAAFYRR